MMILNNLIFVTILFFVDAFVYEFDSDNFNSYYLQSNSSQLIYKCDFDSNDCGTNRTVNGTYPLIQLSHWLGFSSTNYGMTDITSICKFILNKNRSYFFSLIICFFNKFYTI